MIPVPLRLLVVDDDEDTCQNLSDILGDLGYEVQVMHDGPSALRLAKDKTFDIALLDLKMPGMDGLELYRELKKLQPMLLSILVTGYASPETEIRARDVGTWRILPKPVDLQKLLGFVQEVGEQPLLLIVDDDPDMCSSLSDVFSHHGFRVGIAYSPSEALVQLSRNRYQVLLVDLKLNGSNGTEVFRAVRSFESPPRTLLMTGHRQEFESTIADALAQGADAVCYKPFDIPGLLHTVRSLLPPAV